MRESTSRKSLKTPSVTVAVASAGRPSILRDCLAAIAAQSSSPDETIVVAQTTDKETQTVAEDFGVRLVLVQKPGLALAIQAAIEAACSDVVAFVDDDAQAFPDWVKRIRGTYAGNDDLGFVGGRDNVNADRNSGSENLVVGLLVRGRIIGNHHLGKGSARPAQIAKGANMSVRRAPAKNLDLARLVAGEGAQANNELLLTFGILSQGYRGLYDPSIQVDHFPASRPVGDERLTYDRHRTRIMKLNESAAVALNFSRHEIAIYVLRSVLIGSRINCGFAALVFLLLRGDKLAFDRFAGSMSGLSAGLRFARQEKTVKR
ncbi:glycosyltransferase family 2 protein [Frigoribacterium sp. 2-23]|uniref:glycosyltransferase family 2 protein n=1 Tax=Frigoribacterium sp. 2-23 TaxID=3415006 RepID=UPI003C6F79AD